MSTTTNYRAKDGKALELVLFGRDSCPYCAQVAQAVQKMGIQLTVRNPDSDPHAAQQLLQQGGKKQVPCLFVNGQPMYESAQIITFLEDNVVRA